MRAFFEGPAGSGKTHRLIERVLELSSDVLAEPTKRLLALTFMNGSRLRLNGRLSAASSLRGRFTCTTFDSFAGMLTNRRRSMLRTLPVLSTDGLSPFDVVCRDAGRLLAIPHVQRWVAASYPIVLVDEAQDLNEHRFAMLRGLSSQCVVVAGADHFQNLTVGADTAELMCWLRGSDEVTPLETILRTDRSGLLSVAAALRSGTNVVSGLTQLKGKQLGAYGSGVKVIEVSAVAGLAAWTLANELSTMSSRAVILTVGSKVGVAKKVFVRVQELPRFKRQGTEFGPFSFSWEQKEEDEISTLCGCFPDVGTVPIAEAIAVTGGLDSLERRRLRERLLLHRNLRGATDITRDELRSIIDDVVRNGRRYASREVQGRRAMSIARAKNREFSEVVVVWPQTVPADVEYQRRLLYNAVTRARDKCSVIVLGKGRLSKPPFVSL